jgi:hypothetical protein
LFTSANHTPLFPLEEARCGWCSLIYSIPRSRILNAGLLVALGEAISQLHQLLLRLGRDGVLVLDDGLDDGRVVGLHELQPLIRVLTHLGNLDAIRETADTDEEGDDDVDHVHGHVLVLLEELVQTHTAVELSLSGGVQIGAELGEGGDLTVHGQLKLHGTGHLLHTLNLGSGTDTGHRQTDRNSRALALVEQLRLQEDLAVSDGNHVGRNVGRHITSLGLDHGQGSEGAEVAGLAHLGSALQKTGVQVEDVTRVGLTSRGTSEQKGHLTVGDGLLGKIVVEDHGVLSAVAEVLTHGAAGVGRKELQRGRVGCGGGNDDGVGHGVGLLEGSHQLGDGGALLADTNIYTNQLLLLGLGGLVDDSIDGDGSLSGLAITNDKLTLATSDGDEGIDGLQAGGHGLVHGLAGNNSGRLDLRTGAERRVHGTFAIDGLPKTINDTAQKLGANWHIDDGTSALDDVTLQDGTIITENHNTDVGVLKIEGHTANTRGEDNHLSGLDLVKAVHTGNTVTNADDVTDLVEGGSRLREKNISE